MSFITRLYILVGIGLLFFWLMNITMDLALEVLFPEDPVLDLVIKPGKPAAQKGKTDA